MLADLVEKLLKDGRFSKMNQVISERGVTITREALRTKSTINGIVELSLTVVNVTGTDYLDLE